MCAENGSNYSAHTDTFPSLETHAVSVTGTPLGNVLHGDEWELILGIEMLFPWGLGGNSEGVRSVFEMHVSERRPEAASRAPSSALRLMENWKTSHRREFQERQGLLGSQAEQKLQMQLFQAQQLFLSKSNMLSRKLQKQQMLPFILLFAHTIFLSPAVSV